MWFSAKKAILPSFHFVDHFQVPLRLLNMWYVDSWVEYSLGYGSHNVWARGLELVLEKTRKSPILHLSCLFEPHFRNPALIQEKNGNTNQFSCVFLRKLMGKPGKWASSNINGPILACSPYWLMTSSLMVTHLIVFLPQLLFPFDHVNHTFFLTWYWQGKRLNVSAKQQLESGMSWDSFWPHSGSISLCLSGLFQPNIGPTPFSQFCKKNIQARACEKHFDFRAKWAKKGNLVPCWSPNPKRPQAISFSDGETKKRHFDICQTISKPLLSVHFLKESRESTTDSHIYLARDDFLGI